MTGSTLTALLTALQEAGIPTAGWSTCPICGKTWVVTLTEDCLIPACGCYGNDTRVDNHGRPCEPCGLAHVDSCVRMPRRRGGRT